MLVLCPMEGAKVIVKKLAYGMSNTIKQYNTPSLHAEMDAFGKLRPYYLSHNLDLIVVRFSETGKLCSSRPCFHCLERLNTMGIKIGYVYYSNDGEIFKEKFSQMMESELTSISSGMKRLGKK